MPDIKDFEKIFEELLLISQTILQCSESELDKLQYLLDQREPLLEWLSQHNNPQFASSDKERLQYMIEDIKSADGMIELKFKNILMSQSGTLCQITRTKEALSSYKFPYTELSGGLENKG